jgi:SAM-dependent MidA family methyltransferase
MTRFGGGGPALPVPAPEALAHSARLAAAIRERIGAAGGWMSFADYMRLALYAPGLGYYSAGAVKFGGEGDFVTAPLISPLFSRVCARRIGAWLATSGTTEVLEFGPGTGRFAADALDVLDVPGSPLRRYRLLEVSADLRQRQRQLLASTSRSLAHRSPAVQHRTHRGEAVEVEWLDGLPERFAGVVFANEILDALPCERFTVRAGEWWRLGVGLSTAGEFEWRIRPADGACEDDATFVAAVRQRREDLEAAGIELPEGCCGEWQVDLDGWFAALAAMLARGVVLLADYGLPRRQLLHPDRMQGSLRCHYRHHAHGDPFLLPGLCDITAWVDFTAVAAAATQAGFDVAGFTTQTGFLLGAGIEDELREATATIDAADPRYLALARGVQRLLLPGEMGEAVKFMLLTRQAGVPPLEDEPALGWRDLRGSL